MKKEEILNKIFTTEDKIVQAGDLSNGATVIVNINNDFYKIKLLDLLDLVSGVASNIAYDNGLSGLTATDVQAAIDEVFALIPTISYPVTGATNGIKLNGTVAELGDPLTRNTVINLSAFTLDIANSLNSRIEAGGTNLRFTASDKMMFLISTLSSTSQNKSLQLNNTDGKLVLVNKGMYGEKSSYYAPGAYSVVISQADGLVPNDTTNTGEIVSAGTIESSLSSSINNTSAADFTGLGYLLGMSSALLQGSKVLVDIEITVRSDINAVLFPLLSLSSFGNFYIDAAGSFPGIVGLPKFQSGYGFRGGTYCVANDTYAIKSSFIFNYTNAGLENSYSLAIYRNINTKDGGVNDLADATIQILGWKFTFRQA